MNKVLDRTGEKYNRLTAVRFEGLSERKKALWLFRCDCGNEIVRIGSAVKAGSIKSCGCLNREHIRKMHKFEATHGRSGTRLYRIWAGMKRRCENPNSKEAIWYKYISLCDEWKEFEPFCLWALNNGYRDDLTIDRTDNKGNYEPNNCRWVTVKVQSNNRSNNHNITFLGETKNLTQWVNELGITLQAFWYWSKKGLSDEEVIERFIKLRR